MDKTISIAGEPKAHKAPVAGQVAKRLAEILLFAGVIIVSSLAVAAVALAAPFVLAASALAAFFPGKRTARGWRPVTA
ncbi:hypothetical protein [Hyphococcus sp.]|uniref:hypothetical protein n=1 Tax=Hyphococcus sp. TaxID=2038636 RepID=UPI0037519926